MPAHDRSPGAQVGHADDAAPTPDSSGRPRQHRGRREPRVP